MRKGVNMKFTKEIRRIGFTSIQLNYNEDEKKEYQKIVIEL